ncbi:glucosamine-6-phosphate deaminase, partial [Bifidobacterium callitrichos]
MAEVIIVKDQEEAGQIYGRAVADLIKSRP